MLTYAKHSLKFQFPPVSVLVITTQQIWYKICICVCYLHQCRISHFMLER